ncbi:Probable ADP-ribosylation factor GTPase-activating protein AGD14 [Linum perenne]
MMGSRKEEERNEKIIRGLLKLPPNRRCINCNSLGPQYVCTNFWTFVCMTCSGIHREFTHRVKSVSMSKFTVQEVEALQNGGNQRARETYLKEWDQERQRLPASSNVDRVREFIKHVYEDKKYAGTKTADKPPRDLQRVGSYDDESRRASSYHSFSQSPPYDFQYEERRYGKQGAVLARRPGSDRGISVGKMSSFIFSPTRSTDRTSEDRFANEGSVSRLSDFSVTSGGDLGRPGSGFESPNFQKESGGNSPSPQPLGNVPREGVPHQIVSSSPEADFRRERNQIVQPQRTMSLGGKGLSSGNPLSHRSNSLPTLFDDLPELEQAAVHNKQNGPVPMPPPALPPSGHSGTAPIDLFQLPSASSPPLDFFSAPQLQPPSKSTDKLPQTFQPSTLDLFSGFDQNQPVPTGDKISPEPIVTENGGWATFDNKTWNAFGDSAVSFATEHMQQFTEPKLPPYNPLAALDMQSDTYFQPSATNSSSHPGHPMMFLDMASLQSALPNDHLSSSFVVDASHSWFPQDPVMNYMPNPAPTGGLPYATGPAPSPPLGTIPAQGPVASIGGNPFA